MLAEEGAVGGLDSGGHLGGEPGGKVGAGGGAVGCRGLCVYDDMECIKVLLDTAKSS